MDEGTAVAASWMDRHVWDLGDLVLDIAHHLPRPRPFTLRTMQEEHEGKHRNYAGNVRVLEVHTKSGIHHPNQAAGFLNH